MCCRWRRACRMRPLPVAGSCLRRWLSGSSGAVQRSPASHPIRALEFRDLLQRLGVDDSATTRIGVALSGGSDSSALTLLAHEWATARKGAVPPIVAIQVDHRLRPESAAEVDHCALWLAERNIEHRVVSLQWDSRPPLPRLQEAARERRFSALTDACRALGVSHLLMGHHAQDQHETVLHRFARSSGVHGLAGMALLSPPVQPPHTPSAPAVRVCHPLLRVDKARLLATCARFGVQWVEDPSNFNEHFDRVRSRLAMQRMQHEAAGHAVLSDLPALLSALTRAKDDLDMSVRALLHAHVKVHPHLRVGLISAELWTAASEELCVAAVSRLLAVVRGSEQQPSHSSVLGLVRRISRGTRGAVLCFGCVLRPVRSEEGARPPASYSVTRANTKDEVAVSSSQPQVVEWDRRFVVRLTPPAQPPSSAADDGWEYVLRALWPAGDLVEGFRVKGKGALLHVLQHNLPVLVRRKKTEPGAVSEQVSAEDEQRRERGELLCFPHFPFLRAGGHRGQHCGWMVTVEPSGGAGAWDWRNEQQSQQ